MFYKTATVNKLNMKHKSINLRQADTYFSSLELVRIKLE